MTELEAHAAGVTDEAAGIAETPEQALTRRMGFVRAALDRLERVVETLDRVERSLGAHLPDVMRDAPLGDAVDLVSEIHIAVNRLTNDGVGGGAVEKVKSRLKYVKEVTLPERFTEQKITSFNTERFRVTKTSKVFASILTGQQEGAYQWLRDNDLGGLIKPTVNSSSLSATAKEFMENGKELPDDFFRAHFQLGTSITVKRAS